MDNKIQFLNAFYLLDGALAVNQDNHFNESLCVMNPEKIIEQHRHYIESGSSVICSNTKDVFHYAKQTGGSMKEIISSAVQCAKKASEGTNAVVALLIGPCNENARSDIRRDFDYFYHIYAEMTAEGESAGAHLILFEGMRDLNEARAAVIAAKEKTSLPVIVTLDFENPRESKGHDSPGAFAVTLTAVGADALGLTGGYSLCELKELLCAINECSPLPLVLRLKGLVSPMPAFCGMELDDLPDLDELIQAYGVFAVGGAENTRPDHIRQLRLRLQMKKYKKTQRAPGSYICSKNSVLSFASIRIIGSPGGEDYKKTAPPEPVAAAVWYAKKLQEEGADAFSVSAKILGIKTPEQMTSVMKALQEENDIPLVISADDPILIEAALKAYTGKAMIYSVYSDQKVFDAMLPLAKRFGSAYMGITVNRKGVPPTAEGRVCLAWRIYDTGTEYYNFRAANVYIDCVALPMSTCPKQAREALNTVKKVKQHIGLHTALNLTGIFNSFPNQELLEATFFSAALLFGLDIVIADSNIRHLKDLIYAFLLLDGRDGMEDIYRARFS